VYRELLIKILVILNFIASSLQVSLKFVYLALGSGVAAFLRKYLCSLSSKYYIKALKMVWNPQTNSFIMGLC